MHPDRETLTGIVERVTFHAADSGYTIARLQVPRHEDLVTIAGSFPNIEAGQTLKLTGNWREHPQYGPQFQVERYEESKPATLTGIEKYLGSGFIKGVGRKTAKRIVAHFGMETLEVIESDLDRLYEVEGLGKQRVARIKAAWAAHKAVREVMVFLQSHAVSTVYAAKIFKKYGAEAIAAVTDNPYKLSEDIYGIGFKTADKIAENIGVSPWSKFRFEAGLMHLLSAAADAGHCYLPLQELAEQAVELLALEETRADPETITEIARGMVDGDKLVLETPDGEAPICYRPSFFYSERNLARLLRRQNQPEIADAERVNCWLAKYCQKQGLELSAEQQAAVQAAVSQRLCVITGGPGVGKTFVTRTIVALWKAMGKSIGLAAPTGRAAKRMEEVTGLEAKTLHRLLEFEPKTGGFKRNEDYPLPYDALVVDETSMLDLFLAYSLLRATPPTTHLLLVGDRDQLPSVGPGQVLHDLIESERIPVVRLTKVFRQAAASAIVRVAHEINSGEVPEIELISETPQSNCLWHGGGSSPEYGANAIAQIARDLLPKWGFDPVRDLQVLSPMIRGAVGAQNLNTVLQSAINPPGAGKQELRRGPFLYREGDRVIQLKNDYDRGVFNGDLGVVRSIRTVEQEVIVEYDGREVTYDYADLIELGLAWAITIHKSQGSEFPVVLLPIYRTHAMMLNRNLLYTGLTRAKKLAVVMGEQSAIAQTVRQESQMQRYTLLRERLTGN